MTPARWLRAAFAPRPLTRTRPHARRLAVEQLEVRENPSTGGVLDPTFGSGGIVHLPSTTDDGARAVVVQPDGKVIITGTARQQKGSESITVQRLNANGSLDTTFNRTGSLTIGSNDYSTSLALQPDGKILVGGSTMDSKGNHELLVARLNPNGTLDTTFGSKGLWLNVGNGIAVEGLAVLTDASHTAATGIIAATEAGTTTSIYFGAVKLTPAGQPDKTFGTGGFSALPNLPGHTEAVAVAPSGEVYLAGSVSLAATPEQGGIAALTPAGQLDTTFNGGAGYVLADPTGTRFSDFYDLAVQTRTVNGLPVSRLVAAGTTASPTNGYSDGFVAAFTLAGAPDTTFGAGGMFIYTNPPGADSEFEGLAVAADGSIVLGGYQSFTDGSIPEEMLIGRLTADGAADTSFGTDGTGFIALQDGYESVILGVAVDPTNGDIAAGGGNNPTKGVARQAAVARFTA